MAERDPTRALVAANLLGAQMAGASERPGAGWISPVEQITGIHPPEVERALASMWGEAFRAGSHGLAADVVAGSRRWGFALSEVRARTALFYGDDDHIIGPGHRRWWARSLPRAELLVHPAAGHLVPFVAWADILRAIAR